MDSAFVARFGRRKTWLVPVQYLIGATMLVLSKNVDYYLEVRSVKRMGSMHIPACACAVNVETGP